VLFCKTHAHFSFSLKPVKTDILAMNSGFNLEEVLLAFFLVFTKRLQSSSAGVNCLDQLFKLRVVK
jgi:predicted Zn-dependent protease